ncbi:MAG: hypothetical protein K8E66_07480, partial [Phycisphaerales bacterium]|nr:hypothetical protein [Phycisphaerales bacterium]
MNAHDNFPGRAPLPVATLGEEPAAAPGSLGVPQPQDPGKIRPLPEDALIVLPVRNVVLFPGVIVPIGVGRRRSQAGVRAAVSDGRRLGVFLQRDPGIDEPGA